MEITERKVQTIALMGHGKMGNVLSSLARVVPLEEADVCIDFSHPGVVLNNVRRAAALKKPIVMGTTGWHEDFDEVRRLVLDSGIGFIYTANFSIGVNIFLKLCENASRLVNPFPEFDIGGFEAHNAHKADMPSGTARMAADALLKGSTRKKRVIFGDEPRDSQDIHFSSLRVGATPGTHEVFFDSGSETISLKCTSRNRESFAEGALYAADWILDKKGFYTFKEAINL